MEIVDAELDVQKVEEERRPFNSDKQPVAVIITNLNMPERADALAEELFRSDWPFDLFLVDNGSDIMPPAKWTSVHLDKNIQTTGGWLAGVEASRLTGIDYLGYLFLITSAEFVDGGGDVLASMAQFLVDTPDAVGIHPALTEDSTTAWEHLKTRIKGGEHFSSFGDWAFGQDWVRRTFMIDNICSLYRRTWWDEVGGFDPRFTYAWGPDLDLGLQARRQGRSLWIDERVRVRKTTDIGYDLGRMRMTSEERRRRASANMDKVMRLKYGSEWKKLMYLENWG